MDDLLEYGIFLGVSPMRYLIVVLLLAPLAAIADSAVSHYDPAQFEKRFHQADKDNKGKLTRAEAYAEFPRAPEFFDEIDANKDGFITLVEVQQAVERRVNAAIDATDPAKRYGSVDSGMAGTLRAPDSATQKPSFSSKEEERRYYRQQQYEALAADKASARNRGEPVPKSPSSPLFKKAF
jgi:hypothetical protein